MHSIASIYPQCKELFCQIAGVRDNEIDVYISESKKINQKSKTSDISAIFLKISEVLRRDHSLRTADTVHGLLGEKIFPIRIEELAPKFHHLGAANDRQSWYIADDLQLYQSFNKQVPLLAFPIDEIAQMNPLFDLLDLRRRKLSVIADSMINVKGSYWLHSDYTESLRSKMGFIVRCVMSIPSHISCLRKSLYLR